MDEDGSHGGERYPYQKLRQNGGVGRRPQPERRAALLAACTDELLRHGLHRLTLARLATAAGTSSRMLLYHFTTRDQLVLEALHEARRRQQAAFEALLAPRPGVPYGTVLAEAWDRITAPELRPYLLLFAQLHDLPADRTPWTGFRVRSITDWLPTIEAALRADGHPDAAPLATAITALVRGLLQDLNTTADHQRTTDALRAIATRLRPEHR
jgi:AcrR family transcriptional regulator